MVDGAAGRGGQRSPAQAEGDRGPAGPREGLARTRSELSALGARKGVCQGYRRLRGAAPPPTLAAARSVFPNSCATR